MRINLLLETDQHKRQIPINYQYPLSSAIYHVIQHADKGYADFLHNEGYGESLKRFKLFTFSDISTPFQIKEDRLLLTSNQAKFTICFHLPQAAESFIRGLFISQQIDIADKKSKVAFHVRSVESITSGIESINGTGEIILKPISPLVCGVKNEKGNYIYLSPEDERFVPALIHNCKEKYKTLYGEEHCNNVFSTCTVDVLYNKQPSKPRLITIKAGTPSETKIRGFVNFSLKIKVDVSVWELLLNAGVGLYNAQGMGCVEVVG